MNRRTLIAASASLALAGPVHAADAGERFRRQRRFVDTRFGRIAVLEKGRGEAALFLHGFPLNAHQWRGAMERLAPHRRCIAPDFLGLGYTEPRPGQGVAAEDQVEMLVALLDAMEAGPADVVTSDSGGAVAQLLLARHPGRVRSLLLANCDTEIDCPPPALQPVIDLAREGRWVDAWLAPWLADPVLARSAEGIGGLCYADPAHPTDEALACYFAPLVNSPAGKAGAEAYAVALDRNVLAGVRPTLQASTAPTRIVWGTADPIFSTESPAYLDASFGASRGVRRLEGRKLFWPEELPEEAMRLWGLA
jgi:pimeloyl-ACP methyl ester carboxylesterase